MLPRSSMGTQVPPGRPAALLPDEVPDAELAGPALEVARHRVALGGRGHDVEGVPGAVVARVPGAHPTELGELGELLADGVEDGDGVAGQSVLDRQTAAGVGDRAGGRLVGAGRGHGPPHRRGGFGPRGGGEPEQAERGVVHRAHRGRRDHGGGLVPVDRSDTRAQPEGAELAAVDGIDGTDDTEGTSRAAATPAALVVTASDFSAILPGCPRPGETRARWGTRPARGERWRPAAGRGASVTFGVLETSAAVGQVAVGARWPRPP